jgi:hypothetical protein
MFRSHHRRVSASTGLQDGSGQARVVRGFMSTLTTKTAVAFTSVRRESDKARVYEAVR